MAPLDHLPKLLFVLSFAVCGFSLTALAHEELGHEKHTQTLGHEHGHHNMTQHEQSPSNSQDSYWTSTDNKFFLYAHIGLMVLDWVIVLPISVMFAVAKSNLHLPAQVAFLILNAAGIICSFVYNAATPDRYPSAAHNKLGWYGFWILMVQAIIGIIFLRGIQKQDRLSSGTTEERMAFIGSRKEELASPRSWISDSAHGASLQGSATGTREPSLDYSLPSPVHDEDDYFESKFDAKNKNKSSKFEYFKSRFMPKAGFSNRTIRIATFFYQVVQRLMVIFGLILILTGFVTLTGVFMDGKFFNGLAHLVKGGIFFLYGIITLGRYFGSFADLGWAWNVRPSDSLVGKWLARIPSAEMTESFVIFLYGITNVWLEHLANWGNEWSAMDLEHVSISFWFIGGGLCGMLLESRKIRDFMDKSLQSSLMPSSAQYDAANPRQSDEDSLSRSPNFNPAPALVFFMLGILMGSHHQHAHLGATIHKQWGLLLSGFAVLRLGTYGLLYLSPPTSYLATRPFTELLGSFCLMSGGLIFMMSNSTTVDYLIANNIDAMFVFTLMIGLTGLLMSWETALIGLKGWAVRRELLRSISKLANGASA